MVQIALSKFQLTKIVTVVPFFLVINSSCQKLRYMEQNEQADLWIDTAPGQHQSYWPVTDSFNMYVKYDGSNISSIHFPIKSCHSTVLRMDQGRALCVEVTGGMDTSVTIIFTDYKPGDAPARVENLCEDVFLKIHQKNQSQATLLAPYQRILYTWDEPSAERTLMWNVYGRKRASYPAFINRDGSGEVRLQVPSLRKPNNAGVVVQDAVETDDSSSPEDESDEMNGLLDQALLSRTRVDKMVIFWMSYLEGMQRVLLFTQDERVAKAVINTTEGGSADIALFASIEGVCLSVISAAYQELALLSISSNPSLWEVLVKNKWRKLDVELATWLEDQWRGDVQQASLHEQIEADLSQMQMTKPYIGALRRSFHPGIWCQYQASKHHMALNMTVQCLQVKSILELDISWDLVLFEDRCVDTTRRFIVFGGSLRDLARLVARPTHGKALFGTCPVSFFALKSESEEEQGHLFYNCMPHSILIPLRSLFQSPCYCVPQMAQEVQMPLKIRV
ncbi:hypothetical protein RRG08_053893 [Elysia crispata]|uniref:Vacuolar protein sorting-associated protein 13 VPS13 adaptor binding domain-containing protein n=1 Tax=Elysia crispata TaxID=231223 RepID=A0AAE0ZNW2_9GAST|nr:hypothetical protein RRG08_053893 [Elysia crispata]